jgi:hypothetical protein
MSQNAFHQRIQNQNNWTVAVVLGGLRSSERIEDLPNQSLGRAIGILGELMLSLMSGQETTGSPLMALTMWRQLQT